jgi:hypothetical protein
MQNLNGRKGSQLQTTEDFTIEGYEEGIKEVYKKKYKEQSIAVKYKKEESTGGTRKSNH